MSENGGQRTLEITRIYFPILIRQKHGHRRLLLRDGRLVAPVLDIDEAGRLAFEAQVLIVKVVDVQLLKKIQTANLALIIRTQSLIEFSE